MSSAMIDGPDYSDPTLAIAYRWIRHKDGKSSEFGTFVLNQLSAGLEQYAESRSARLIGTLNFDFPDPLSLPAKVQQPLREAMAKQEPRIWRRFRLTLVRAWQPTKPAL